MPFLFIQMTKLSTTPGFILCALSIAVFLVYFQGLGSQFQFDDHPNIIENVNLQIKAFTLENIVRATLSGYSGLLGRPVSMLSFALNHYWSGLSPFAYKLTNVVIHSLNSFGIYCLCLLLLKQAKSHNAVLISFCVALAWAVHPINLTSVLYIVQRMTSLSASFVILGMILYLYAKIALHKGNIKSGIFYLAGVCFSALYAVLSKENGALIFIYLLLIELVFFRDFWSNKREIRFATFIFFAITVVAPLLLVCGYTLIKPEWITAGYAGTAYSLTERLLTELRVVWCYAKWIILPDNQSLGLFHDDIAISHGLFDETLPILAGLAHFSVIAGLILLWFKSKLPLFIFGCAFFYSTQLMESTILPLELVHEHRNYLSSFGLLFALFSICFGLIENEKLKKPIQAGIATYIVFLAILTCQRAATWGNGLESALIEIAHHPQSAQNQNEAGRQYTSINTLEFQQKARGHFKLAAELDNNRADSLLAILVLDIKNKKPIDPTLFAELKYRLSNGPAYASYPSGLLGLIKCWAKTECQIKDTEIADLMQAFLDNKRLPNNKLNLACALNVTAEFLVSGGNNYENARQLAIEAANTNPGNLIFIIHVIELAIRFKDFQTAEDWIKKYESHPAAFLSRDTIQSYKKQLPAKQSTS
jgi:protein O-mannosyl-transferase